MKSICSIIISVIISLSANAQNTTDIGLEHGLMWQGHYKLALELLLKKQKADSTNYEIKSAIIFCYYQLGEVQKSDSLLNSHLKGNEKNPHLNSIKGIILIYQGNYKEASKYLEKAYHELPNDHNILYNLALSYDKQRKFKKAIKYYSLNTGDGVRNFDNRGRCYMLIGDYDNALKDFNYGITKEPENINLLTNRATLYMKMKKYDLALLDIEKTLAIDHANAYALRLKAHITNENRE
ncbi:MAG: tetratricopeptide repeat protein [Flavobacteriales bacterium]